jgi:O-antigen ligase
MASASDQRGDEVASALLMVLIFSLAFMQPSVPLLGFAAVPTDLIYFAVIGCWAVLLLRRRSTLVWDRAYAFIGLYFLAMLVSVPGSESPRLSALKLLTQAYLLSLPVLVCSLVDDERRLRTAVRAWLAGTAVVAIVALLCLAAFALDPGNPLLQPALSVKGTLPPGHYPRLQITFMNANMACNYLTVSLLILVAARQARWIGRGPFLLLLGSTLIAAAATISPGLGGIAFGFGLWTWLLLQHRPFVGRLFLAGGAAAALAFVGAMTITPILRQTAPYLIRFPALDATFAPSGRLMIWSDAARHFLADPWTGRGIGVDPVMVNYVDPSGVHETLTDAHNSFLSIAVQCGIFGLAAFLALLWHMTRRSRPWRPAAGPIAAIRVGIGIGLVMGLAYEGLGGSFEDARHLWVALGLLLASDRIARRQAAAAGA